MNQSLPICPRPLFALGIAGVMVSGLIASAPAAPGAATVSDKESAASPQESSLPGDPQTTAQSQVATSGGAAKGAGESREQFPDAAGQTIADYDRLQVGRKLNGRMVIPTNQVLSPLGRIVEMPGRPTAVALSPDRRLLAVLDRGGVVLIDVQDGEITSRLPHPQGSWTGIAFSPDGRQVFASSFNGSIEIYEVGADRSLASGGKIDLGKNLGSDRIAPAGIAVAPGGDRLWVVLNLRNTLAEVELAGRQLIREIEVGNAPYEVALVGERALVSNWGGRAPEQGDVTGPSGRGRPVRVDPQTFIANDGSVSVVDLRAGRETAQIPVGLHPSGLAVSPDQRWLAVANANSDTVSIIDVAKLAVAETISTRLADASLFGSAPNAACFDATGDRLFVANGTNNAIAVIEFSPANSRVAGFLPTAWYPAGLVYDSGRDALYCANVKGIGSRNTDWRRSRKIEGRTVFGFNSHDYQGAISLIDLPGDEPALREQTLEVLANNRLTQQLSALAPPRPGLPTRPVPERHGEPSSLKHVLYIIKENRTYDQVFGDIQRGEGDPDFCIFGREVTPNHHQLVDEFVLLDNFYCNGSLSADGHQWTDEAYVTDYIEKAYGGWPRSYPYDGNDALAYASSGFLWDNALRHGKSLRVYGEFVKASIRWRDPAREEKPGFLDCYRDFVAGTNLIEIRATATIESLQPYLCETAIGFPGIVPDIHRAQQFIDELARFEDTGELPHLTIMLLPNDHTAGTRPGMPTPAAAVADNDLALGRIVAAVSHSRFWPETCIFVVQDDPQAGFDHVDGRRTVAMVISPYTRRGGLVDSTNYNQTSMVRTIELILGLPPMNQLDSSATPMTSCFVDTPDLTPYQAVPNRIPLDQMNPPVASLSDPRQRHWALVSQRLPLDDVDEADEGAFNRILWHARRGRDDSYPEWAEASAAESNGNEIPRATRTPRYEDPAAGN